MRTTISAAVVVPCLLARCLFADLDVGVPPGTPLEWKNELPFHQPEGHRGPIYTHTPAKKPVERKDEDDDTPRGRTIVVKPKVELPKPPSPQRFGGFNPMGAARILTMDITGHHPWASWRKADQVPGELSYPPETRVDLYWLTLSTFFRIMLHPAKVSNGEIAQYLTTIGPPVLDTMEHCQQGLGPVRSVLDYLRRSIPPVPPQPPDVRGLVRALKNPEVEMLVRWSARELVSDHPYAFNPLYAKRTRSLGGEAVPVLLALAKSKHSLLRENAAGLLAGYDAYDKEVLDELRSLFRGKDPVARNRVLEGLIGWRDKQTEKLLIRALGSKDQSFSTYAIQALGRMQSSSARAGMRKLLSRNPRDHGETWLAAVAALSRVGDPDGKSRKLLKALGRKVGELGTALDPPGPAMPPDSPDQPGDRARMLEEAILIALARLGDAKAGDRLLAKMEVGGGAGGRLGRRVEDPVLGGFEPFNQLLAIEALASLGDEGRGHLQSVVKESMDFLLRGYALEYLLRLGRNTFVFEVAQSTTYPSVLRVQAMEGLARDENTRGSALKVARGMVDSYLGRGGVGRRGRLARRATSGQTVPPYECLSAIKLLGKYDPLPADTLAAVVKTARTAGHYEQLVQDRSARNAPGRGPAGPGQVNTVTLRAFPALCETAVVELGRLEDVGSFQVLKEIVDDLSAPGRVEAALGLGNLKVKEACDVLITLLDDKKPWVRYSAYRALRTISGEDHFADWIFGKRSSWSQAVTGWKEWRQAKGAELPTVAEARKRQAGKRKA